MDKSGSTMRSSSRSPSFIVIALVVVLCILAFNYWSLSQKNKKFSSELETLQVDFRTVSEKHLSFEKRAADLAAQLTETQTQLSKAQGSAAEKENKVKELTGEVDKLKGEVKTAKDAQQTAQKEVENVQNEKKGLTEELGNVKKQLTDLQNAAKVCDKNACKEPIREVISALAADVGKPQIAKSLGDHNVDVMQIAGDLLEGGGQPARVQPQPGQGNGMPNQGPGMVKQQEHKQNEEPKNNQAEAPKSKEAEAPKGKQAVAPESKQAEAPNKNDGKKVEQLQDGVLAHWRSIHATPHQLGPSQEGDSRSMPQSPHMIPMCWQSPEVCAR